jgi:hypothetical protein
VPNIESARLAPYRLLTRFFQIDNEGCLGYKTIHLPYNMVFIKQKAGASAFTETPAFEV